MAPFSGVIAKGLKVVVGCQDQPDQHPVVFSQNSDGFILLTFEDEDGGILDISGATAIEMDFLEADGTTVLSKTLGVGIQLVAGSYNQALVTLVAADLALLPVGENDAQVKIAVAGVNYAVNCYDALTVQASVV